MSDIEKTEIDIIGNNPFFDKNIEALRQSFFNGLYNLHGVTKDELREKWTFAGGDPESDYYAYFKLLCKSRIKKGLPEYTMPKHETNCVCGRDIWINCFITNYERFIVVGSCCIGKFMENGRKRTCEICKKPHRNSNEIGRAHV